MTIEEAARYLSGRDNFIIVSHDGPDADGLGAAYALALSLESIGKRAVPAVSDRLPLKFAFIDRRGIIVSLAEPGSLPFPASQASPIIVDTHDMGYLGERSASLVAAAERALTIDHHELKSHSKNELLLDPTASSTCEIVFYLAKVLGASLPLDAAEAIFAGLVYDTGSFAYPKTSERTFACAFELVKAGVLPYEVHKRMYESSPSGILLLEKAVISSLELALDGRIAFLKLTKEDLAASEASYEDAEDLVNIPLQDRKVEVSVLFKENSEGRLRCSLRSKGAVNVAHIAQAFGGGGHKTAAGFTCADQLARVKVDVLQSIAAALPS